MTKDDKPKKPASSKASDPQTLASLTDELMTEEREEAPAEQGKGIDALLNVKLDVRVVLGRSRMPISQLLELTRGSVVELDRKVGDPVDIMINDRMVAKGELVKVNGDYLGVALRDIVKDFIPSL